MVRLHSQVITIQGESFFSGYLTLKKILLENHSFGLFASLLTHIVSQSQCSGIIGLSKILNQSKNLDIDCLV